MLLKARWRFVDEPRIHAGERGVTITVGHKWVRFRDLSSGRTSKVRREIYELTKPNRLIAAEKVKDPSRIAPAGKAINRNRPKMPEAPNGVNDADELR